MDKETILKATQTIKNLNQAYERLEVAFLRLKELGAFQYESIDEVEWDHMLYTVAMTTEEIRNIFPGASAEVPIENDIPF